MKKIANIFLILLASTLFLNCEEDQFESSLSYVSFGDSAYSTGVDIDGTATVDVVVYTSKKVSSDVTFNVETDGSDAADGSYSVPATVTVPSGSNSGILTVTLSDVSLGIGVNKLLLSFTDVESGYSNGAATTVNYIQNCNETTGTLDIVFDGYASETGWEITDALGGTVASGGGYDDGLASVSESVTICADRSYTFTITDTYGDGLSYPNSGSYTLTFNGEVKASGGGDFGTEESTEFDTK